MRTAIETARAGSATGEVTAVLRTLPSQTQRRVPFRLRHRIATGLLMLLVLAAIVAGILWLLPRAHHGTGKLAIAQLPSLSADDVAALERAGVDAVIVGAGDVAELAADATRPA